MQQHTHSLLKTRTPQLTEIPVRRIFRGKRAITVQSLYKPYALICHSQYPNSLFTNLCFVYPLINCDTNYSHQPSSSHASNSHIGFQNKVWMCEIYSRLISIHLIMSWVLETFHTFNVFNIFIISHQAEGRTVIPLGAINQAGFISCDIVLPSDLSEGEITGELLLWIQLLILMIASSHHYFNGFHRWGDHTV